MNHDNTSNQLHTFETWSYFFVNENSDFFLKENMYLREKLETKAMRTILKKLQNVETLWFPPLNISAHYSFDTGHSLFI